MEEIIPALRDMLKETIKIEFDENNLEITMFVKSKIRLTDNFTDENEVKIMLHMFGGLKRDFPMKVKINKEEQKIKLIFDSQDNMKIVQKSLENIWDRTVDLLEQCIAEDFNGIKDIGDIDD